MLNYKNYLQLYKNKSYGNKFQCFIFILPKNTPTWLPSDIREIISSAVYDIILFLVFLFVPSCVAFLIVLIPNSIDLILAQGVEVGMLNQEVLVVTCL